MAESRPLFVLGLPRSGTKLLRALLNRHASVFIPDVETECLPWLARALRGGTVAPSDEAALWQAWSRAPCFAYWQDRGVSLTWPGIVSCAPSRDAAGLFAGLIEAVRRQQAPDKAVRWWGDKSPSYLGHVSLLRALYPSARFVHIVRDVRDLALSSQQAWGKHPLRTAQRWRDTLLAAQPAVHDAADVLELRYETLVADPESVLRAVCGFLDLTFEPAMLALDTTVENLGHARGQAGVVRDNTGRFRATYSPRRIAALERVAADVMAIYGYAREQYHGEQRSLSRWRRGVLKGYDGWQLLRHRRGELGWRGAFRFYRRYRHYSGNRFQSGE